MENEIIQNKNYTIIRKILSNTNDEIYLTEDFKTNIIKSITETKEDFDKDLYVSFLLTFIDFIEEIEQKTCEYELNELYYINENWNYSQKISFSKKTLAKNKDKKEYKNLFPTLEKLVGKENSTKLFISHLFKVFKNNKLTLDIKEEKNETVYEIDILSRLKSIQEELNKNESKITQEEVIEKLKPYNKIISDYYKEKSK